MSAHDEGPPDFRAPALSCDSHSVELFNLLGQWAPGAAIRRKILVDNPKRLFGF